MMAEFLWLDLMPILFIVERSDVSLSLNVLFILQEAIHNLQVLFCRSQRCVKLLTASWALLPMVLVENLKPR